MDQYTWFTCNFGERRPHRVPRSRAVPAQGFWVTQNLAQASQQALPRLTLLDPLARSAVSSAGETRPLEIHYHLPCQLLQGVKYVFCASQGVWGFWYVVLARLASLTCCLPEELPSPECFLPLQLRCCPAAASASLFPAVKVSKALPLASLLC